jgi:hypothetical protein
MELVVMTLKTYFQLHLMVEVLNLTGSTVGNPNLKFKARKSEIGLESAMFNNFDF